MKEWEIEGPLGAKVLPLIGCDKGIKLAWYNLCSRRPILLFPLYLPTLPLPYPTPSFSPHPSFQSFTEVPGCPSVRVTRFPSPEVDLYLHPLTHTHLPILPTSSTTFSSVPLCLYDLCLYLRLIRRRYENINSSVWMNNSEYKPEKGSKTKGDIPLVKISNTNGKKRANGKKQTK